MSDLYHLIYIYFQIFSFDEIIKSTLTELIVECPEIADIADVLSECAVVFCLCHVKVCYSGISFLESVHCKLVSFFCDIHCSTRYHALLALVVELAYGGEDLSSVVILMLLHLSLHDFLSSLSFLHSTLAESPVEDRNAECYSDNFLVKIGTSAEDLVNYCGGITTTDCVIKAGGPMMGFPQKDVIFPIMKGSNGIITVDTDNAEPAECIKCGRCVDVCPMELKPLYFYQYAKEENWEGFKAQNVMDCMECRCCEYICSSKLPLVNMIKMGKNGVRGLK